MWPRLCGNGDAVQGLSHRWGPVLCVSFLHILFILFIWSLEIADRHTITFLANTSKTITCHTKLPNLFPSLILDQNQPAKRRSPPDVFPLETTWYVHTCTHIYMFVVNVGVTSVLALCCSPLSISIKHVMKCVSKSFDTKSAENV